MGLSKVLHDLKLRKSKKGQIKMEEAKTSAGEKFSKKTVIDCCLNRKPCLKAKQYLKNFCFTINVSIRNRSLKTSQIKRSGAGWSNVFLFNQNYATQMVKQIFFKSLGEPRQVSNVLRFVMVPLITQERCVKPISIFPPEDITANMVCAANENGGRGTCVYDEGGPLIIPR